MPGHVDSRVDQLFRYTFLPSPGHRSHLVRKTHALRCRQHSDGQQEPVAAWRKVAWEIWLQASHAPVACELQQQTVSLQLCAAVYLERQDILQVSKGLLLLPVLTVDLQLMAER